MKFNKLPLDFFRRDTTIIAQELLGKLFVRIINKQTISAEIIETEAYLPKNDPACHAAKRQTLRNSPMFEDGGILYVYFIYGNHFCANIVTEKKGLGSAVLIRAACPIDGIEIMKLNRNRKKIEDLCSGPGKFAQAFGLTREHNNHSLISQDIFLAEYNYYKDNEITTTTRIGIREGANLPLRFYVNNSEILKFISKK